MVERFQLLRNVGQFDSVNAGGQIPLTKLTMLYAENGRGKTTLAAILRSLGTGDAAPIGDRHRLGAAQPPHVVVHVTGSQPHIFQLGAWSANLPRLKVFDDTFVAENVCSGIEIETEHRQNLHELILGAQGVTLNAALQAKVEEVEEHNRELRTRTDRIPAAARGTLTVDAFCALQANPNVALEIQEKERNVAAAQQADAVQKEPAFPAIALPKFDIATVNQLLGKGLPDLEAHAARNVQQHLAKLGDGAERWVSDGMHRIAGASADQASETCPFCAQDLAHSPVINHYRAYFSEAYANLKQSIAEQIRALNQTHAGDVPAAFERLIRVIAQSREFWKSFAEVPEIAIDTAAIARSWKAAREALLEHLKVKQAAPLEPIRLGADALAAIALFEESRTVVRQVSENLLNVNERIAVVREQAAAANLAALSADLVKLRAVESRYSDTIAPLCASYTAEKTAKMATEGSRDQARAALDQYRRAIFPAYETAINTYLQKFNAGFRLGSVNSVNIRGGSSCNYNVLINNVPVALTAAGGGPSFRSTLSAGDRNALALAFFFASLEQDPQLAQQIVVIDDPMTSLDEHRSLTTVQEVRRLVDRVAQVIVLSHSKPFLCALWEGADKLTRSAMKIMRDGTGSTLAVWDVRQDCITEHDKRHALVSSYLTANVGVDERAVAAALRPILESFMRVAYPADFPPGTLLGPFLGICQQRSTAGNAILSHDDMTELRDLLDYANKFHHDTNAAWETEVINDQELIHFSGRALAYTRRT